MRLKPVEMVKVRVVGLRSELPSAVEALHESGLVEIRNIGSPGLEKNTPGELYKPVSEQLIRLRGIENGLKKRKNIPECRILTLDELLKEAGNLKIDSRLSELARETDARVERKKHLSELKKTIAPFKGLGFDFSGTKSKRLKVALGGLPANKLSQFKKGLDAVTKNYALTTRHRGDRTYCLIAVDVEAEVGAVYGEAGFAEIDISGLAGKPEKVLGEIDRELADIEAKLFANEKEVAQISERHYPRIVQLREMLEIEADRLEVAAKFGRTEELFAFEGFVQKSRVPELRGHLTEPLGERFVVQESEAGHGAPTLLEHNKAAGPLQFLVEFYSLPQVNELDPTLILFFTFPIIYGMMLGDVGYGLLSLLISLLLIKKFKNGMLANFAKLWAYASIPSIVFGVIFDEWMGFSHSHLLELLGLGHFVEGAGLHFPLYHGMSRIENVQSLLALTLITGFLQLLFGFALGVINDWNHHRKHSYAKIGWMGVLTGGFFSVAIMFFAAFPAEWLYPLAGLFGLGVLAVLVFEGPMGIFEIPGLAGNVLSYARIAGVGLASVVPAEFIINKLLLPRPEAGIVMFIVMIPVYIGLHAANTLLGMVESLAQGARLNLVEFYSKFYKGSGRRFAPFRVERKYTER